MSYRLGEDRVWRLAPAYDLTYCEGPGGEHQMDVGGEARAVSRSHLVELVRQGGVEASFAQRCVDDTLAQVDALSVKAASHPIRTTTLKRIRASVEVNRNRLR